MLQILELINTDVINNVHFNFLPLCPIYLLWNALIWGMNLLLSNIHNGKQLFCTMKAGSWE